MRGAALLAIALIAAPIAGAALPATSTGDADSASAPVAEDLERHPPIRIRGDEGPQGFVLGHGPDGEPLYRPGSGVVAGSGTADDPYVIRGWDLSPLNIRVLAGGDDDGLADRCQFPPVGEASKWRTVRHHAIEIKDTDAHVVIKDNRIAPRMDVGGPMGVGHVDSNRLVGIQLADADNVRIHGNQLGDAAGDRLYRGVCAKGSDGLEIVNNRIEHVGSDAVRIDEAAHVDIHRNTVTDGNAEGVLAVSVTDLHLAENTVTGATGGMSVISTPQAVIDHNTVRGNEKCGISVSADDVDVTDNVIADRDVGRQRRRKQCRDPR